MRSIPAPVASLFILGFPAPKDEDTVALRLRDGVGMNSVSVKGRFRLRRSEN